MTKPTSKLTLPMNGACNPDSVVQGDHYRFTLITEHILRIEYAPDGIFEDRPSQTVLNRYFPAPDFSVKDQNGVLEIDTANFHLTYHHTTNEPFRNTNLVIQAKNYFTSYGNLWRFGETTYGNPPKCDNLKGTTRTLDRSDGAVKLDLGLMDKAGRSFFDDSESALLEEDGSFSPRREGTQDVYYICCQHDYRETLSDFYRISGAPPMLPRFALGNWWSRWWQYTEQSYTTLMEEFSAIDAPFTVAVLDMDWHITKPDPKYGSGWTGFTWNREFFPDPKRFLQGLKQKGMHTTLNLHPAEGVRAFEEGYPAVAKKMGVDTEKEEPVVFDFTNPNFVDTYFDDLLRPHEEMGVDFWWMDWQQGTQSAVKGLDPLWLLNHFHYLDNSRNGKRGLLLSRYCGLGSQRYPVGFSGDTEVSWKTLDFQPYFTATATNAGFPWWSHDIGGFHHGTREPELFCRWLQLGVFSPFVRLHSTRSEFLSKDPRTFGKHAQDTICKYLRLRHAMIPYLYTEIYRQHKELSALVTPLYYEYPDSPEAYQMKNQFFFGSQLMVCPITSPANTDTQKGSVTAWIPEGTHTDIFTGKTYMGHRITTLHRTLDDYPVLAKPGAILPLAKTQTGSNCVANPEQMQILVFPGKSNTYTLFEDDGQTAAFENGSFFETEFTLDWENKTFTVQGVGDATTVPDKRSFQITFRGFENFVPKGDGIKSVVFDPATRSVNVTLFALSPTEKIELSLEGAQREKNEDAADRCREFLMLCRLPTLEKMALQKAIESQRPPHLILEEFHARKLDPEIISCLSELILS